MYLHHRREGRDPLSDFSQALLQEETRKKNHWAPSWCYQEFGFYYLQLKRYFDRFNRNQIKIYLYEDLQTKLLKTIQDMFQFLNVDDTFVPDTYVKHNQASHIPKNQLLSDFLTGQNRIKDLIRPLIPKQIRLPMAAKLYRKNLTISSSLTVEMRQQMRQELTPIFREDILKLEGLLERQLSQWLE